MGEGSSSQPRGDIPRGKDEEFLQLINEGMGDDETPEAEQYDQEVEILCRRMQDIKRMRNEIDALKGEAVTYLELLSLPDEARRERGLLELARRAERIVEEVTDTLETKHQVMNTQLLETLDDAKAGLVHLKSGDLRTINDELLARYKDMQDLKTEVSKAEVDYKDQANAARHRKAA